MSGRRDAIGTVRRRAPRAPAAELVIHARDEAIAIPPGDTTYTIDLDQQTVESLERGICPEDLAQRMHDLLRWRRAAIRATTAPAVYEDPT